MWPSATKLLFSFFLSFLTCGVVRPGKRKKTLRLRCFTGNWERSFITHLPVRFGILSDDGWKEEKKIPIPFFPLFPPFPPPDAIIYKVTIYRLLEVLPPLYPAARNVEFFVKLFRIDGVDGYVVRSALRGLALLFWRSSLCVSVCLCICLAPMHVDVVDNCHFPVDWGNAYYLFISFLFNIFISRRNRLI